MIKAMITNTAVRKIWVFTLVFVMAGAFLGFTMVTPEVPADHSQVPVANRVAMADDSPGHMPVLLDTGAFSLEGMVQPLSAGHDRPDVVIFGSGTDAAEEPAPPLQQFANSSNWDSADRVFAAKPIPVEEQEEAVTGFVYLSQVPMAEDLQAYTYGQCEKQDLDYALVLALMWRESRFQTQAVNVNRNGTRDNGIMQINDVNRGWLKRELAIDNLMDPYQNIDAGTEMLGRLVRKYGVHNALMAYQYGEGGMKQKIKQGVTTNRQIQLLYQKQAEFQAMLDKAR